MSTSRKIFIENVQLASDTPTSIQSLLLAAGYGWEPGANNSITTTPSLDSFIGDQCFFVPNSETVYVGHDQYVRTFWGTISGNRVYKGFPVEQGSVDNVVQPVRGLIDANQIWLYSTNSQEISLTWIAH